ncbi:outer membrane lipoprotein LolB [uncultured Limnohabitans sp.]|jgi:outer membrane lipoprotein LolB|uniref:outer membrane lipoprotein LolB n=1 Tax=uncultured Limnohabitans sp. TaxID=768543 RepID=UPI0026249905|nr:outer membrane lipoprotein LolB [uncultured Limnohabitans sp.]
MNLSAGWTQACMGGMTRLRAAYLTGTVALVLLATGCATNRMPVADPSAYWSGRLAIQVFNEPTESMSASFELQGSAQTGEMHLFSPIGTTLARLEWTPERARLDQGQQQLQSPDLASLTTRLTGTALPINALFEWLAGRPADAPGWQADLTSHAQGRITAERRLPAPKAVLRIVLDR